MGDVVDLKGRRIEPGRIHSGELSNPPVGRVLAFVRDGLAKLAHVFVQEMLDLFWRLVRLAFWGGIIWWVFFRG